MAAVDSVALEAPDAGVAADGAGSHGIVVRGAGESFTDPDGFAWEAAAA